MRARRFAAALSSVILVGLAVAAAVVSSAAGQVASSASPSADSGYAVAGKQLIAVESWVTLPHAADFAREAGSIGASVQLWTAHEVIDLRVASCTDRSCKAGGTPVTAHYRLVLNVYNRATHALICSTAATGSGLCSGQDLGQFRTTTFRAGTRVELSLSYPTPYDIVFAQANNQTYLYNVSGTTASQPQLDFTGARVAAEFGASPWSAPGLRAPSARMTVMSFDRPTPPPFFAEIANFAGRAGGFAQRWWTHTRLATDPGPGFGRASTLRDDGYGFTVYLER